MMRPTLKYEDYTIGWICALPVETTAAMFMLDKRHSGVFPGVRGDDNNYIPGTVSGHNVVIASLPDKEIGPVSAASLVSQMRQSFPNLRYGLMVGIGAGVPGHDQKPDIRLGDVVVATPGDDSQGIVDYELGKETMEGFIKKGWLNPTDRGLRNAFRTIQAEAEFSGRNAFAQHLEVFQADNVCNGKFKHPGEGKDLLYHAINTTGVVERPETRSKGRSGPVVHYGLIASGNKVVKNAKLRDKLREKYKILCFEMEAAGLMNILPIAVIRGISDYADSHKNDDWQPYAAAVAAAYAKGLLDVIGVYGPSECQ
jgi:nucleoside phosphorylase